MKKSISVRLLSILLTLAMFTGLLVPVSAADVSAKSESLKFEKLDAASSAKPDDTFVVEEAEDDSYQYADNESVRVSIVLEEESTIAKFGSENLVSNDSAMNYRAKLEDEQADITAKIEKNIGTTIDVKWNLTLAANIISANVEFGTIDEIKKVPGVKDVIVENRYEPMVVKNDDNVVDPNMSTSSAQIGSTNAWAAGYTGAGSRIAVIDTGIDLNHQSFAAAGYEHSLEELAEKSGKSVEEYKAGLKLLDKSEIEKAVPHLNIAANSGVNAENLYQTSKIPFAYNYIDENFVVDHDHDTQGEHGSHVEGIAAANKYIENEDGTFVSALDSVKVQGVAPDAQLIVMKVFGQGGGAYDSDYMAAIEDAVVLGCDSVNLSLGSGNPGFSRNATEEFAAILDSLAENGTVVTMSAGNSYSWPEYAANGNGVLYGDDVSFQTNGSPGSFTNSLTVASVENDGFTGNYFSVAGNNVFFSESSYSNAPLTSITGEHDYVFLTGYGTSSDYATADVKGKVVFVSRGALDFATKANNAVKAGAIATVVYNNAAGALNMNLTGYNYTAPVIGITLADAEMIMQNSTVVEEDIAYTGTLTVSDGIASAVYGSEYYTMSDFSSWGTPGSLELKPEITAPGGNIYSVNGSHRGDGAHTSHDSYENMSGTSMASPQVAGMAALVAQYIRETGLTEKTGLTQRQLINSLLMSTAKPVRDASNGNYYSVIEQGAGLANVGDAVGAKSYIMMKDNLSGTASDGKVKAEFGDDPEKKGVYTAEFTISNLTDEAQNYTISTDVFTQGLAEDEDATYLLPTTTPLSVNASYVVDGKVFVPAGSTVELDCDLDGDGDVDADDAQIIIDYVVGNRDTIDTVKADLDNDGKITSYDAYLLHQNNTLTTIKVDADSTVNVSVKITLTDASREALEAYVNGAYIEGYINVETDDTDDGEHLPVHTIPMLGFYGNWSDADMYDTATYIEKVYGDTRDNYTGEKATNYLAIRYSGEKKDSYYMGNPYVIENEYPADRTAINGNTKLAKYTLSLIRNAGAAVSYIKNADGDIVYMTAVENQVFSAYYYVNGGTWQRTTKNFSLNKKPGDMGFKEGDKLTSGVAIIPEYYEKDGALNAEQVKELITSGTLGDGAIIENTFTVDNTAPELLSVEKSESGAVTVKAKDNQYIAAILVANSAGTKVYDYTVPEQTNPGEECEVTFNLRNAGIFINVVVADYAGNETAYKVYYGGTADVGTMYGFTAGEERGEGQRWYEVNPNRLYYSGSNGEGGLTEITQVDYEVVSAEYVGGYVFFTTFDGLYVAPYEDLTAYEKISNLTELTGDEMILDMAYNSKDGKLYALTGFVQDKLNGKTSQNKNSLYTIDFTNGALTKVADITAKLFPGTSGDGSPVALRTLAIDAAGNFYSVSAGRSRFFVYFYTWTLDSIVDGKVANDNDILRPAFNNMLVGSSGSSEDHTSMVTNGYSSMTYDFSKRTLYLGAGYGYKNHYDDANALWVIDTRTGTADQPSKLYNARFYDHVVGLFTVTAFDPKFPTDVPVKNVVLDKNELVLYKGAETELTANVTPWLLGDKSVTWTTSNSDIVTVENGYITAVGVGTATVRVTSNKDNTKYAECTVIVREFPNIKFNGLVYGAESVAEWAKFQTNDLAGYEVLHAGSSYVAGALHEGNIIVHDGSTAVSVDPATFEATPLLNMGQYVWSDAAESPKKNSGRFGKILALAMNGTIIEFVDFEAASLDGFNVSTMFGNDPLAAIAYIGDGVYEGSGMYPSSAHFYYMMTEGGVLYKFIFYYDLLAGDYNASLEYIGQTNVDLTGVSAVTGGQYGSMLYDAESGFILVSTYLDGDTATLYAVNPTDCMTVTVGTFGDDIWPVVALYKAPAASGASVSDEIMAVSEENTVVLGAPEKVSVAVKSNGSLNAAAPESVKDSDADADNHVLTVNLKEDVDVTNGKYTVTYDPAKVTVTGMASALKVKAFNNDETNGVVTFAFADKDGVAAGTTLATVTFEYGDYVETEIKLDVVERNDDTSVEEETVVITIEDEVGEHEWVETDRVEPTCTEDGYIEYTCTKCSETKKETLKALGHEFIHEAEYEIDRVEPTCTEDGYVTYKCSRCDETETVVLKALGHNITDEVYERVEPTCTEDGYVTYKCSRCDKTETEVLKALGHNFVVEEGYAGLTRNKLVCSRCGLVISGNSPIPVLNPKTSPILNPTKPTTPVVEPKEDDEDEEPVVEEPVVEPVKSELPFTDVTPEDWFYTAVEYLYNEGIMNGTSETEFSPEYELNRATVVTILYRLEGEPEVETAGTFSDVEECEWYTAAVEWAASVGIVKGYEDGTFAPKKAVTREQLAAIIYRYAEFKGITIAETTAELGEEAVVSDWAKANVEWAVSEGLLVEGENVNATENANRAEVAAMIYTFLTKTSVG